MAFPYTQQKQYDEERVDLTDDAIRDSADVYVKQKIESYGDALIKRDKIKTDKDLSGTITFEEG